MSWTEFQNTHAVGDVIEGVVTSTVPFGSFVEYAGVTGLAYEQQLPVGTTVSARILAIDPQQQRFSLEQA
ncbi:S1 RNA-binding domain-containing protein [Actinokineospora cianjurensis]|uniref:S1 RNA binding family protein n=1 Tax=Actinokineospora cianjurensis TaxID=585224 RepID=A0A421AWL8_9PSEU|nr:S1 RNA-binding domain-containing protein [Actinokineospora cianjurensis]RLK54064.1 S1 RNA binding family protein [Actinokineospora cianjurensis]